MVIAAAAGAAVAAITAAVVLVLVRRRRRSGRSRGKASGLGVFGLDKGDDVETVAIEADSTLRPVGALTVASGDSDAFFFKNDAMFVDRKKQQPPVTEPEAKPVVVPVSIDVPVADGSAFLFQNELFKSAMTAGGGGAALVSPRDVAPRIRLAKFSESYASQSFKRTMVASGNRDPSRLLSGKGSTAMPKSGDVEFSHL